MTETIHVRLAASACGGCPVAALSTSTPVEDVRVHPVDDRIEFVAADPPDHAIDGIDLVEFGERAHGRYTLPRPSAATDGGVVATAAGGSVANGDGGTAVTTTGGEPTLGALGPHGAHGQPPSAGSPGGWSGHGTRRSHGSERGEGACSDCSCGGIPDAFAGLPVTPHEARIEDGELLVSFVLTGRDELETVVDALEDAGLSVELRRLLIDGGGGGGGDGGGGSPDALPVDLTGMTERRAEVARLAAERGYFRSDGASAESIADELGLAKSTVSEHLRLVTDDLFSQLFADERA